MEDQRKVDFKKYISKPVSKWYLARIIFYIVLLTGLLYLFFSQNGKKNVDIKEVERIDKVKVTIENWNIAEVSPQSSQRKIKPNSDILRALRHPKGVEPFVSLIFSKLLPLTFVAFAMKLRIIKHYRTKKALKLVPTLSLKSFRLY